MSDLIKTIRSVPYLRFLVLFIFLSVLIQLGFAVFDNITERNDRNTREAERVAAIEKVKNADPKEYVNFYSVKVDDAIIGDAPQLTLCRKLPKGLIKIDAVRTFIKYANGEEKQVGERGFTAAIEPSRNNTDCTTVDVLGQPQMVGTYSIRTEYSFSVPVEDKLIIKRDSYESNKYKMTDDIKQLEERLQKLQEEYDRRISGGAPIAPTAAPSTFGTSNNAIASEPNVADSIEPEVVARGSSPETPPPAVNTRRVCDPLISLLGLKIGETNCREEEV